MFAQIDASLSVLIYIIPYIICLLIWNIPSVPILALLLPFSCSQAATVKDDGNGAAVAASVLFDLAVYCRCSHLLLLLASCLPAPCQCLSMDYTLPACLHVALQLQPCLLAEQASLLEKHHGTNVKTASFPIKKKKTIYRRTIAFKHLLHCKLRLLWVKSICCCCYQGIWTHNLYLQAF